MQIPENIVTFETELSIMWFDREGILCSVYKNGAVLTKDALKKSFNIIKRHKKQQKICWLGEVTHATPPNKDTRDFAAEEVPKFVKALAILSHSQCTSFIANMFLALKKLPFPAKVFADEQKARKWLRKYLGN